MRRILLFYLTAIANYATRYRQLLYYLLSYSSA
jgi:hypothetical protein